MSQARNAIGLLTIIGCCSVVQASGPYKVSMLVFDGCPNSPKMKANLIVAMRRLHWTQRLEIIDIYKLPESDLRRGYGAPTVLVDGKDLFGRPLPKTTAVTCRVYPGGVPTTTLISYRLKALTRA